MKKELEGDMLCGGLGEHLGSNQHRQVSGIIDLAVIKEEVLETLVDTEMKKATLVKEVEGGRREEDEEGNEEEEEDDESSEASSSSDEEEKRCRKDDESSEALSSSEEEEDTGKKDGGGDKMKDDMEMVLEECELMVGSDEEDTPKGPIKSKHEVEVLPPVPKVEVHLEPHHQTLPVGTISAIMGERVIVEGSVQHNPLNEGSILWITESRTPLGIVDELFGPVKNPYYLVRYNSEKEVPAEISVGTTVSFVMEFANHILNAKELYSKGYDASGENDEELTGEPEFSDDEKESEYRRSLRQPKRQSSDRQLESKKHFGDKKRTHPRGPGFQKCMPPMNRDTPIPGHQSYPHFNHSNLVSAVADNTAHSMGPQNLPVNAPTFLPPVPMVPAMSSAVQLAAQMGGCFINPAQQFLPSQLQQNMGIEGAALAVDIWQNLLIGASQFQQQFQNQNFGGYPSRMPVPSPQQFTPHSGIPAHPSMLGGGQRVNPPFGAASNFPMGQDNFVQVPFAAGSIQEQGPPGFADVQGFGQLPLPHGEGGRPPMHFNSGQFGGGTSSFRGRRPHQRGSRHFSGRGGRHQNS